MNERIKNHENPHETIPQRVAQSGFWIFSLRVTEIFFSLAKLVIIARILAPHDFGLMGIAMLTMGILNTFSQTGFRHALIQKKGDIRSHLDSAWVVLILRGFILFIILYFAAPYVALFFNVAEAKTIFQIIGISMLLKAFTNIGVIYFQKELEFKKEFIYRFLGVLAEFITTISAILILRNVWALVLGFIVGAFIRLIASYILHPYRPIFKLDLDKTKELFGFGRWILASSILAFLLWHGDDIFVAKILTVAALGYYQMAYKISSVPATEFSQLISRVAFPAYSQLQDDLRKLRRAYLKVLQITAFLSIPMAGGIFILAPEFTQIFLGEKWMPMVPAMQILAFYGMLRALGGTTEAVFNAVGKPEINTRIQFAKLILMIILIYPLIEKWGIVGAAIAVTAYALTFNLYAIYKAFSVVKAEYKKAAKLIVIPVIGTLIMFSIIHGMKNYAFQVITYIHFFLFASTGILVYFFITLLFDISFNYGIKKLIKEQFANLT